MINNAASAAKYLGNNLGFPGIPFGYPNGIQNQAAQAPYRSNMWLLANAYTPPKSKLEKALDFLGSNWVFHPDNKVPKLGEQID